MVWRCRVPCGTGWSDQTDAVPPVNSKALSLVIHFLMERLRGSRTVAPSMAKV